MNYVEIILDELKEGTMLNCMKNICFTSTFLSILGDSEQQTKAEILRVETIRLYSVALPIGFTDCDFLILCYMIILSFLIKSNFSSILYLFTKDHTLKQFLLLNLFHQIKTSYKDWRYFDVFNC